MKNKLVKLADNCSDQTFFIYLCQ